MITTSWQIYYVQSTKENIYLKPVKKLHASYSCSLIQNTWKLLQMRVLSLHLSEAGQEAFPTSLLSSACVDQMSPVLWWTSISNCKCKVSPHLISTTLKLLCLPSSSAVTEWVFPNFSLVQTKPRNQLGLEKAAKLVTCYRQLRGNAALDWRMPRMEMKC